MVEKLKPLVGVVCDVKVVHPHPFHMVGDKYLVALAQAADVTPVLIPALSEWLEARQWSRRLDGLFLTGGYSMVHPSRYGSQPQVEQDYDERRDAMSLAMLKEAEDADLPVFGVCRGFQEINVAHGGSLHQELHEVEGLMDHRENKELTLAEQYAPSHPVRLCAGGLLQDILGVDSIRVNSLHTQGVEKLGHSLATEAVTEDGLVEAFRIEGLRFGLGVQWHPEWQVLNHPQQRQLFEAFGNACRA